MVCGEKYFLSKKFIKKICQEHLRSSFEINYTEFQKNPFKLCPNKNPREWHAHATFLKIFIEFKHITQKKCIK